MKALLKTHQKLYLLSLDFLNKCRRDVDEDSEIVIFDVISLYAIILHEFGLEVIDYF